MKIEPYYHKIKIPMTLVSGNIYKVYADIRGGSSGRGASNDSEVVDGGNFGAICGITV